MEILLDTSQMLTSNVGILNDPERGIFVLDFGSLYKQMVSGTL
jgi:hypothetical protein